MCLDHYSFFFIYYYYLFSLKGLRGAKGTPNDNLIIIIFFCKILNNS
ncbi:MAG: hypothetical protein K6253_00875 [Candidatus Liberibacter asiaticus]|nr:hypothetical protein [Candidatus Liberibacter asiaticus]